MQAQKIYLLLVISLIASIIHIHWSISIVTVFLIGLYGFSEYLIQRQVDSAKQFEKRIKDLEEHVRTQSIVKAFR